jgi:hypothetical protein
MGILVFICLKIKAENKIELMENPIVQQSMMRPSRLIINARAIGTAGKLIAKSRKRLWYLT